LRIDAADADDLVLTGHHHVLEHRRHEQAAGE
jgi:hypothetical protein